MLQSAGALVQPQDLVNPNTVVPGLTVAYSPAGLGLLGYFATYGAIYEKQGLVYSAVNKLGGAEARLPLGPYKRTGNGPDDREALPWDNDLSVLLRRPNPKMSGFHLKLWIAAVEDIYGEAFLVKVRKPSTGKPIELWPMHPSKVAVLNDANGEFLRLNANPNTEWRAEDVVMFRRLNPENPSRGLSPLEPLRQTLQNEDAARRATTSFWQRGARPGTVLTHPKTLSDTAQKHILDDWNAVASGADRTGNTIVLEEGMKPERLDLSSEEAQYIQTRKLNREEVCIAYDIPPPAMHILDHATFSNITEQMRSVYRDTMPPRLDSHTATYTTQLVPDFDDSGETVVDYDLNDVLAGDPEQRSIGFAREITARSQGALFLVNAGYDPKEVADLLDLDVTLHVQPADQPALGPDEVNPAPADTPPATTPSTTPVTAPKVSTRAILGRLGVVDDVNDLDVARLTKGLEPGKAALVAALVDAAQEGEASMPELRSRVRILLPEETS